MKRVLLVTDVPFWQQRKGNHQRIAAMVAYLADHFEVTVVFLGVDIPQLPDYRVTVMRVCRHRGLSALAWKFFRSVPDRLQQAMVRLLNRLHLQRSLASFVDDHVLDRFASIYNGSSFDAVIVEYIWHGYLANAVNRKRSLLLLDTHDIFHRRMAEYANFGRTPDKIVTREQELAVYEKFDRLIAIQALEFDYLETLFPGRVLLAMHPVDAHPSLYGERMQSRSDAGKLILVFFASYGDANVDGINWFVGEVWDSDLAEQFELHVHGAICDSLHIAATGVRVCGRCPDVDTVYRDADIAINPQRFGSGLKIKTVEAMGYGVQVLTTSVGAEGLEEMENRALLCANDSASMREQLFRLADATLRSTLSKNALEFVAHSLTPEACFGSLRRLIDAHHAVNDIAG
jgi:glycosyltransferase involved in cell wall biosynthesis